MQALSWEGADSSVPRQLLRGVLSGIHKLQAARSPRCLFDYDFCERTQTYMGCHCSRCESVIPYLAADTLVAALPSAEELAQWGST